MKDITKLTFRALVLRSNKPEIDVRYALFSMKVIVMSQLYLLMKCLEFADGKYEDHPRFEGRNFTIERKVSHHWAGGRSEQGWCSSNGSKPWIIWNNLYLWTLVRDRLKMLKLTKRRRLQQHRKWVIWLVESGEIIVRHVLHACTYISWT